MRIVLFYHSLISDWNHGNAHFLRGVVQELRQRGHRVDVYEPRSSWSVQNLLEQEGEEPIREFHRAYPGLRTNRYDLETLDLDEVLERADLVIAHEWNEPELIARLGEHRKRHAHYRLLFHDTHHRIVTEPEEMEQYDLEHYDGVLVFGQSIAERYFARGWTDRVWVWHEAADTRHFRPLAARRPAVDLVWIGNWGDDERTAELHRYLIDPVQRLRLRAEVWGVRYPAEALQALERAGVRYRGWTPNFQVPRIFANARVTVHVPRRIYTTALHGIPTIRPFEALACGIPLVSAPWRDTEGLFRPGEDFLLARNGREMRQHVQDVLNDASLARKLSRSGLETIRSRHTCAHRVEELLSIHRSLAPRKDERTRTQKAIVHQVSIQEGAR